MLRLMCNEADMLGDEEEDEEEAGEVCSDGAMLAVMFRGAMGEANDDGSEPMRPCGGKGELKCRGIDEWGIRENSGVFSMRGECAGWRGGECARRRGGECAGRRGGVPGCAGGGE